MFLFQTYILIVADLIMDDWYEYVKKKNFFRGICSFWMRSYQIIFYCNVSHTKPENNKVMAEALYDKHSCMFSSAWFPIKHYIWYFGWKHLEKPKCHEYACLFLFRGQRVSLISFPLKAVCSAKEIHLLRPNLSAPVPFVNPSCAGVNYCACVNKPSLYVR